MFGMSLNRVVLGVVSVLMATVFVGCECFVCPKDGPTNKHLKTRISALEEEMAALKERPEPMAAEPMGRLIIRRHGPEQVNMGQEYEYTIDVINRTGETVRNIEVTEDLPPQLQFISATPDPVTAGPPVKWNLAELANGDTETLKVRVRATDTGTFLSCALATYETPRCAEVMVVEPALALRKSAPEEVLICDQIPMEFEVENTGTGMAEDIRIEDELPEGLVTIEGDRTVTLDVGDLAAGESRKLSVMAKAQRTGTYQNSATASGAGDLGAESNTTRTVVRQPVLKIAKEGRERQFIGQKTTYKITVQNTGDAPAENTMVRDEMPRGTSFVSASDGGTQSGGMVTWNLGTLQPDASRELELVVRANEKGEARNTVRAEADCADAVSASTSTTLAGIPAILLEVVDVRDPIEVGDTETYNITVTNQGSADDRNVQVVVTLEDEMEYVSSDGPTEAQVDGRTVTFAPLDSIGVGEKVTWSVDVKAVGTGDVRLSAEMTSDMLQRPVNETEATNFYE